jgi:hypothetical protein
MRPTHGQRRLNMVLGKHHMGYLLYEVAHYCPRNAVIAAQISPTMRSTLRIRRCCLSSRHEGARGKEHERDTAWPACGGNVRLGCALHSSGRCRCSGCLATQFAWAAPNVLSYGKSAQGYYSVSVSFTSSTIQFVCIWC